MSDETEYKYQEGVDGPVTATATSVDESEVEEGEEKAQIVVLTQNPEAMRAAAKGAAEILKSAEVERAEAVEEEEAKELTVLEEPGDESAPEQVINIPKDAVTTVGDGTGPNATIEVDAAEPEVPVVMKEENIYIGGSELPVEEGTELMEGEKEEAEIPSVRLAPSEPYLRPTVIEEDEEPEPTKIAIISLFHNRKTEVDFESCDGKPWTWKHISMVRASLRRGFAKYNADRKKELRNAR